MPKFLMMVRQFTERDFGPTYGATLTLDVLRVWNILQCLRSKPATDSPASA
ncbi:MAG TPA: hypothetical protein VN666_07395 [Nitrospira sp.]|nr:hypothetical protein [Nitrospira sp.]